MDLAYLRAHPQHLPTFLTHQRIRETPVGGGDVCTASRLTLDDGASLFAKTWPSGDAPAHFFATEAAGLNWLREANAAPVPEVFVALDEMLALEWVEPGSATPATAERFGRELAAVHRAGADSFGALWPGFLGPLPQDNTPSTGPWTEWFAERRLQPCLETSRDRGALSPDDVVLIDRVLARVSSYETQDPPARIHGDLWPGNVLWAADGRGWLIDPAAHGGHRETDLAQLALFGGAPHLDRIIAGYQEVWPLSDGWQSRVPLHQLHLLLLHTAAFGAAYRGAVLSAVAHL
ncbi:fructosamine kinase family protein [Actinoplanes sp. N902-109]|uniref:fructosamine kinase family protein n=1 Tax=Actinoplanes sp. (strain N902-109) TaxID=649831 RepID=UPI0003294BAF|nr:fructosamine kinase family protein [Actinoplanes sp. N902-109]AGL21662.1 aminoglycoside phosphotransferase [Actinoplanes sp. N902-109]